jgi:hypothetical protein
MGGTTDGPVDVVVRAEQAVHAFGGCIAVLDPSP